MLAAGQDGTMTDSHSPRALPTGHPPLREARTGVLLVNLGSPSGKDTASVRRYLRQFLSDPRVIEVPRPIWWLVLNIVILTTRPQRSAHAYAQVWNNERNEAPLVTITRAQAEALGRRLAGDGILVDWAMRYGAPAIGDRLAALRAAGCERILFAPLYPQYSAATTATANDAAFAALRKMRWQPAIRTLPAYYDRPAYIDALAQSLAQSLAALDFEPDVILASFHGMPRATLDKGDPYHCQCQKTGRLLAERMGMAGKKFCVVYQSRFGRAEWLKPYFDETIAALPKEGAKRVAVVMPGFSADCLETLEEIAIRGAEMFRKNGGERYAAVPCLNDSPVGMDFLEGLVRQELAGWR
jgi:ferrochelatase